VSYEGKILGTTKLVSISSVDQSRYEYVKSIIFDSFKKPIAKVIVAVVIIAIILYIFFMINGRKRRRRRYNKTVSKNYIGRRRR
jgi:uncharacterized integral membrane protein